MPAIAAGDVADRSSDRKWLEPIAKELGTKRTLARIELDVQGAHCSACIWLFETLFRRQAGGAGIVVDPAVGRVDLTIEPAFDLARFVATIERLGYRFGPPIDRAIPSRSDLVWRMGVCIAIAMNTMIFGVSFTAHDLWLVFFLVTGVGFGLVYATAVAVFRPIDRLTKKRSWLPRRVRDGAHVFIAYFVPPCERSSARRGGRSD